MTKIIEIYGINIDITVFLNLEEKIDFELFSKITENSGLFVIIEIKENTLKEPKLITNQRTVIEFINRNKSDYCIYTAENYNKLKMLYNEISDFFLKINKKKSANVETKPEASQSI